MDRKTLESEVAALLADVEIARQQFWGFAGTEDAANALERIWERLNALQGRLAEVAVTS